MTEDPLTKYDHDLLEKYAQGETVTSYDVALTTIRPLRFVRPGVWRAHRAPYTFLRRGFRRRWFIYDELGKETLGDGITTLQGAVAWLVNYVGEPSS